MKTIFGKRSRHYIGEPFGGGYIFYLTENRKHGLIVSMVDLSAAQAWSNVTNVLIGPKAQSVWNGPRNTQAIIDQIGHVSSAAQLCNDYVNVDYGTGIFDDWYLLSIGEARHLKNNIYQVQKALESDGNPLTKLISKGLYWTSTEANSNNTRVCGLIFDDTNKSIIKSKSGLVFDGSDMWIKSKPSFVRAVRAF